MSENSVLGNRAAAKRVTGSGAQSDMPYSVVAEGGHTVLGYGAYMY